MNISNTLKIYKDININSIKKTTSDKIPRISNLPSNEPGKEGNIILNKASKQFYGHTGDKWVSFSDDDSYDFRQTEGVVPNGVTATAQGLRVRDSKRLATVRLWSVVAPAANESTVIRLFRARGTPFFSFTNLITPFTLSTASFPGAAIELDISNRIIQDIELEPTDYIACSWQHSGTQQMQPLNVNWTMSTEPWSGCIEPIVSVVSWPPS